MIPMTCIEKILVNGRQIGVLKYGYHSTGWYFIGETLMNPRDYTIEDVVNHVEMIKAYKVMEYQREVRRIVERDKARPPYFSYA